MTGLSRFQPYWDMARAQDPSRILEDPDVLLATDFEGGNGRDLRRLADSHYALTMELEPGRHWYSGKSYYFCFGIRNRRDQPVRVQVRIQAQGWNGKWSHETKHAVIRRGETWTVIEPPAIRLVPAGPDAPEDAVDLELTLPGSRDPDNTLFVSNFQWWPYGDLVRYLETLGALRVREIGRSRQNRPLHAVEIGPDNQPCLVLAQTPQPSEMGRLTCRAIIEFLRSNAESARDIRNRFRVCVIPETNPDGAVLGYGLSDSRGHAPFFEANLAAEGSADAPPETAAVWRYLAAKKPLLVWEWHSNNWARRPGHMLLRYRPDLLADEARRRLWATLDERLLRLPDTHHECWTSATEGEFQTSLGYQAVTRLGAMACMIKQHDKFPLQRLEAHAVACLVTAADVLRTLPAG